MSTVALIVATVRGPLHRAGRERVLARDIRLASAGDEADDSRRMDLREIAVAGVHHRSILVPGEPAPRSVGDGRAALVVARPGAERDPDRVGVQCGELEKELGTEGQDAQSLRVLRPALASP